MEKLLLVIKQVIEPFTKDIFDNNSLSHGARGLSFASSAIVEKSVIQKIMSKIEGKSLYLIQFKKDPKMLITELE